jgi:hypothetical protein
MRSSYALAFALVAAAVVATPGSAVAQTDVSRMPFGTSLQTRPGHPDDILMGTTIGPLVSHDGGDTWTWFCENAVGYGGTYDPDYVYSPTGAMFATTFKGVTVARDGCVWATTSLGPGLASAMTQGPDDTIHVAMAFAGDPTTDPPLPADNKIYRSTNDGVSFDAGLMVGTGGETWSTIEVAPSDAQRVYLTGFRIETGGARSHFLFRSINGGDSYTALGIGDFTLTSQSELYIMAIAPDDPDRVLLRVSRYLPNSDPGDEYFLSTNGGTSWTSVLQLTDTARAAAFLSPTEAVIGLRAGGYYRSTTGGASFQAVAGAQPFFYCMHLRPDGELWACTEPYADPQFPAGIHSTTAQPPAWTAVMRFEDDIVGPVDCATGTIQRDCCVDESAACTEMFPSTWCRLRVNLQIVADPTSCDAPDADPGGGDGTTTPPKSCCDIGGGGNGSIVLALVVVWGLRRRRARA